MKYASGYLILHPVPSLFKPSGAATAKKSCLSFRSSPSLFPWPLLRILACARFWLLGPLRSSCVYVFCPPDYYCRLLEKCGDCHINVPRSRIISVRGDRDASVPADRMTRAPVRIVYVDDRALLYGSVCG